jgi:hypothetical protein
MSDSEKRPGFRARWKKWWRDLGIAIEREYEISRNTEKNYLERQEKIFLENRTTNRAMITYLKTCIATARYHLEHHPDQNDHDIRHALEALEIDDPLWKDRIYDPETIRDQKALITRQQFEIDELKRKIDGMIVPASMVA